MVVGMITRQDLFGTTQEGMLNEHSEYYENQSSALNAYAGYYTKGNGKIFGWKSSAGNIIELQEECSLIILDGRRHACRELCRFLPPMWKRNIVDWEYKKTRCPDLKPWETKCQRDKEKLEGE